ncbi:MAG: 30S ribosomal protein S7, partial [Acidobacteria bacterium]
MPRRREVPRRDTLPDPLYSSTLITRFINCMMHSGKKNVSEHIFYRALDAVKERAKEDPVKIFKKALDQAKPVLEVKSRRVGG